MHSVVPMAHTTYYKMGHIPIKPTFSLCVELELIVLLVSLNQISTSGSKLFEFISILTLVLRKLPVIFAKRAL